MLQDVKKSGEIGLPDLKLYFATGCLVLMKEWMFLRNKGLLELEGHNLGFGLWHGYLWHHKISANVDFE